MESLGYYLINQLKKNSTVHLNHQDKIGIYKNEEEAANTVVNGCTDRLPSWYTLVEIKKLSTEQIGKPLILTVFKNSVFHVTIKGFIDEDGYLQSHDKTIQEIGDMDFLWEGASCDFYEIGGQTGEIDMRAFDDAQLAIEEPLSFQWILNSLY